MTEHADSMLIERLVAELHQPLAILAQRLRRVGPQGDGTIVLLTGQARGMGCTTVALSLAAAASAHSSTVVMDGDALERGLSVAITFKPATGWDDSVRGHVRYEGALCELGTCPGTAVLPLAEPVSNLDALLASPRLSRLLSELRRDFDLVVIDGGAVHESGKRWAPWADVALLICGSGKNVADWATAWDLLEARGTHIMGLIETNA
jgi:Mrp family chromosome partitioning ATPase